MERGPDFYVYLVALDCIDHETRRTARGPAHLQSELKSLLSDKVNLNSSTPTRLLRAKLIGYFGYEQYKELKWVVKGHWDLANVHMMERATFVPYTHEPYEFENAMGILTLPGPNSRTRVYYTPPHRPMCIQGVRNTIDQA